MEKTEPKFFFFPYDGRTLQYFSQTQHKFMTGDDISYIVWIDENHTIPGYQWTINEIVENFPLQDGLKKHRPIIAQTNTSHFPIKNIDGYSVWNGCIRIDIDLDEEHSEKIKNLHFNKETYNKIYDGIKLCCQNCFRTNFLYIEHSSSGTGVHVLFYYDVQDKTEETFMACAEYTKFHLFESIDSYVPKMSELFSDGSVFDPIYKKLFQKTYLTTTDYYINSQCTGYINENILTEFKKESSEKLEAIIEAQNNYKANNFDILYSSENKFTKEIHHDTRLKIATALKAATKSKEEWEKEHKKICKRYKTYKNYTYDDFVNAFKYETLDETTIPAVYLENYGFKIDKSKWEREIGPNQYLGDVLPEIIDNLENGINLLIAPTGCGKTVSWIKYHESIKKKNQTDLDPLFNLSSEKSILIIEPLNSIIETKYSSSVKLIKGKGKFPKIITDYDLYVTNYNHLIEKDGDYYKPLKNLDELVRQFRFIVIDESHIIIKDSFRGDVLLAFTKAINSITNIPVIIQTATPMEEEKLFTIKKTFNVIKHTDKNIKYIFRYCNEPRFNIMQLQCMINYYVKATCRNVYVYWNNATLQNLNALKRLFENIVVYHKRNLANDDMQYISSEHALNDKFNIILSSVYFGVGNDLNDTKDAAVIIIGNNTWQEDIQAIGRWRNSKDIEVCQIILPNEIEYLKEEYNSEIPSYDRMFSKTKNTLNNIMVDRRNKDKSVIINQQIYQLKSYADIHNYAIMKVSNEYHSNIKLKIQKFMEYGIDVRESFDKPVLVNNDWLRKSLDYNSEIRDIRNKGFKKIIEGKMELSEVNSDVKYEAFYKIWNRSVKIGLDKIVGPEYLTKTTNWDKINMYIQFVYAFEKKELEFSELYSLLLVREKLSQLSDEEQVQVIGKIDDTDITRQDYYIACGYAIFCKFHNKFKQDSLVWFNYFKQYRRYAIYWLSFPDSMIELLFTRNLNQKYEKFMSKFGDIFYLGDLGNYDIEGPITCNDQISSIIEEGNITDFQHYLMMCYKTLKAGRPKGGEHKPYKKGKDRKKSATKKIYVNDIEYQSIEDACEKLGKTRMTLNRWVNSGKAHY